MNPFESGVRKQIPAVLIYVRHRGHVLMLHRIAPDRPEDFHAGRWNGLGGKSEADESPLETAVRELKEESALDLGSDQFQALGVLQFPNFKPHKSEDWVAWVFVVDLASEAQPPRLGPCPEGKLHWIKDEEVLGLNLWPGDQLFLPYVLKREPFLGTIWYENSQVGRHWITGLKGLKAH